jgi:hypothetical protein
MGDKSVVRYLGIVLLVFLAGCVTAAAVKKPSAPINKMALVSFSVRNWGDMVSGTAGNAKATELINSTLSSLLATTENKISGVKRVNKMAGFVGNAGYRNMSVKSEIDLMLPKMNGASVVNFSKSEGDVVAAKLTPEVAKKLCADLQVDAVVVVYSEWAWAQGHFVPTKRALAKDVVTVWDRSGNLVFSKRVDETGSGVLGGPYSPIVVNEGTIKQWGEAYIKALDQVLVEMKATLG